MFGNSVSIVKGAKHFNKSKGDRATFPRFAAYMDSAKLSAMSAVYKYFSAGFPAALVCRS